MSVLSAVEAVPSRLFGVFTGLLQFKTGIDKKTFQLKINPEQTKTASIFREAVSLGLIEESDGKIKLNNSLLEEDSSNLLEQFRSFVEVVLFDTEKAEKSNMPTLGMKRSNLRANFCAEPTMWRILANCI